MSLSLQCRCGKVRGQLGNLHEANHCVCFCRDCQAFAHFLERAADVLDARGGSHIVQTLPANVSLHSGREHLACMRLTPKGLLRWHTTCCNTPIGNTLHSRRMSFVGLVHSCIGGGVPAIESAVGPARICVHTQSAKGEPKPQQSGLPRAIGWFLRRVLLALLSGRYRQNLFFDDADKPIVTPRVLAPEERTRLMRSVRGEP